MSIPIQRITFDLGEVECDECRDNENLDLDGVAVTISYPSNGSSSKESQNEGIDDYF